MPAFVGTRQVLRNSLVRGIPQQGLLCWLDARDLSPAGTAIATWPDRSGNGNHATQSNATYKPTPRAGTIKSSNTMALDFIGSRVMNLPKFNGAACTALTYVFVCKKATPSGVKQSMYMWTADNGNRSSTGNLLGLNTAAADGRYRVVGCAGSGVTSVDTGINSDINPHVICFRWNGSRMYLDVDDQAFDTAFSAASLDLSTYNTLGNFYSSGAYGSGWYHESRYYAVLAYNRSISSAELAEIKAYYSDAYGGAFGKTYYRYNTATGLAAGKNAYIPSITRLSSGRLILVYTVHAGAVETTASWIKMAYSDDDGATWTGETTLIGDGSTMRWFNGPIILLANGNLVLPYIEEDLVSINPRTGYVIISTDGGSTWSAPSAMGDLDPGNSYAVYSNGHAIAPNGDILVPCFNDTVSASLHRPFVAVSSDGGATWSKRAFITSGTSFSESSFVYAGNTLYALIREDGGSRNYQIAYSYDDGATWSTPTNTGFTTAQFTALTYEDGIFIMYGQAGLSPYFAYSWDGINWTQSTNEVYGPSDSIVNPSTHTSGDRYYIVGNSGSYSMRVIERAAGKWV